MANYRAFQIAFDEQSLSNIDSSFAIPILNNRVSPFFENETISKLVDFNVTQNFDGYYAVLSHKFFQETTDCELKAITKEKIEANLGTHDVVSFFGFKKDNFEMFRHAEKVHKGIDICYQELFRLLGHTYNPSMRMRFVVYRNAFFAKSHIYERYVKEMLDPCIELMSDKKNELLYSSLWKDSRYPYQESRFRKHPELRDRFVRDMGVPYYPFHTFVLERMFSYWLNLNHEITCKHV